MADIIVHFVSDNLVRELLQEVKLQRTRGLHGKIQFINNELQMIKHYVKEAEPKVEREDASPEVKNWVKEVKEVACKIEDVIDDYMLQAATQRRRRRIFRLLMEFFFAAKTAKSRIIASNIGEIRDKLRGLARSGSGFDFGSSHKQDGLTDDRAKLGGTSKARDIQLAGAYSVYEGEDVGNDPPSQSLINWLLEDTSKRKVISVVGAAKMGKTALVRKVYNNEKVQNEFATRLWIQVSPASSVKDLLKSMLKDLLICQVNKSDAEENENLDRAALVSGVNKYLQEKRYLIVFDNVQKVEFCYLLESALPEKQNGSRVLITTENMDIVQLCKHSAAVHVYELIQPLDPKESLRLFYQRVFQHERNPARHITWELNKWSYHIVNKCRGAPQAIAAIGDLLSTKKKTVSEWKKVHDNLGLILKDDPQLMSLNYYALQQGYHDLPHYLKQCLLYFGLFPMGYSIRRTRLLRLWLAERFVEKKHGQRYNVLEESAERYLKELKDRKLVYIDDKNGCRIQDQMHEFIVKKCDELNFCQILKKNVDGCNSKTGVRRLSIQADNSSNSNDDNNNGDDGANGSAAANRVHSLFIFDKKDRSSLLTRFFSDFKFLKVLDFEDATDLSDLPDAVGNLLLLRQLSIRNTKISILPKSIGKLRSLQALDMRKSQVTELPVEINKLVNLLYLQVYLSSENSKRGAKVKKGIARLKTLEKLYFVDLSYQGDQIIKELEKLKQLKKLGITGLTKKHGSALCGAIGLMTNLVSLSIQAASEQQLLNLKDLHPPPPQLQRLHLEGGLEKLPVWITTLKNLVRIRLKFSSLKDDPIIALRELPKLVEIILHRAYDGNQLHFKADGLRRLKILRLEHLPHLKTLKVDKGALSCLETLCIWSCRELQVPADINNIKRLRTLHIVDMPDGFIQSLDKESGKHYDIVVFDNSGKGPQKLVSCTNKIGGEGLSDDTNWGNMFGIDFDKMINANEAIDAERKKESYQRSSNMTDSTTDKSTGNKPKESSERQPKETKSSERDSHEDPSGNPRSKRESNYNTMISKDDVVVHKSTQDACEEQQEQTNSSDFQPTKVDETNTRQPDTINREAIHTSELEEVHFGTDEIYIPKKGQDSFEPMQENVDCMADNNIPLRGLHHASTLESQNSYAQLENEYMNAKAQLGDMDVIPNRREDLSDRPGMDSTGSMADERNRQKSVTIPVSLLRHASTLDSQNSFEVHQLANEYMKAKENLNVGELDRQEEAVTKKKIEQTACSGKRNITMQSRKPKKRFQQIQMANYALLNAWVEASKVLLEASNSNAGSEKGKAKSVEDTDSDFSPSKCVATLDEVEDVSDDVYIDALEKFIVPEWREIFLSMPPQRRKAWLDKLG